MMELPFAKLRSTKSTARLEQVAALRARGIGEHINLPQLVVCGDQSAGKSSVLEGLTGIPFPRRDGLCTRFATEILLQHTSNTPATVATILPSSSRSESEKANMRKYSRSLTNFEELSIVIEEAGVLMGIRGFGGNCTGPAFSRDILRISVSGPDVAHLTVVDLPGLISVPTEEQAEADVQTVHDLVQTYIENSRTIILAVVQASNDIANQTIIQKSRRVDLPGQRTVGIITKPDLINEGTEERIALLSKNQDAIKLKLGYFLLKNPSPLEIAQGITADERNQNELTYFTSSPWKEQFLQRDRIGITSLRSFLQFLLDQHIEKEMPKVRDEITALIAATEQSLAELGEERSSIGHARLFLSRLAMRFHHITMSALNGTYHEGDSSFFICSNSDETSMRLRATVHRLNTQFSDLMRERGEKRRVMGDLVEEFLKDNHINPAIESLEDSPLDQELFVSATEMKKWVQEVYLKTRGKELPGNYNHILLSELFHVQSSRWPTIAEAHLQQINDTISAFVHEVLNYITKDDEVLAELLNITGVEVMRSRAAAKEELQKILEDERQQPITYNHYYTDNVQRRRQESTRKLLRKAMEETREQDWNGKLHISNTSVDAEKLLLSLEKRIIVDMDNQACEEALAGLSAYYKVAMKSFVDNVCRQVVERHLLRTLPAILSPEKVALLADEDLLRITAESQATLERRVVLRDLLLNLKQSVKELGK